FEARVVLWLQDVRERYDAVTFELDYAAFLHGGCEPSQRNTGHRLSNHHRGNIDVEAPDLGAAPVLPTDVIRGYHGGTLDDVRCAEPGIHKAAIDEAARGIELQLQQVRVRG